MTGEGKVHVDQNGGGRVGVGDEVEIGSARFDAHHARPLDAAGTIGKMTTNVIQS